MLLFTYTCTRTFIYMHSYFYIHVLVLLYTCTRTFIYMYSYFYIHVLVLLYTCTRTFIYMYSYFYIHVLVFLYTCTRTFIYMYSYFYIHVLVLLYTCTRTFIYMYSYFYIHALYDVCFKDHVQCAVCFWSVVLSISSSGNIYYFYFCSHLFRNVAIYIHLHYNSYTTLHMYKPIVLLFLN